MEQAAYSAQGKPKTSEKLLYRDGLSRVLPTNLSIFGAKTGLTVTAVGTGFYLTMVAAGASIALYMRDN